jgi:RHS repeat-associated protein
VVHIYGSTNILAGVVQGRSVTHWVGKVSHIRISYCPFGFSLLPSGSFCGQKREQVTGHYLLGHGYRAFNPVLRRFSAPDELSPFSAGGLNAYVYCAGDPINRSDPSGRIWEWLKKTFSRPPVSYRPLPALPPGYPFASGSPPPLISAPGMERLIGLASYHDELTARIMGATTVAHTLPLVAERRITAARMLKMVAGVADVYLPPGPGAENLNPFRYMQPRGTVPPEPFNVAGLDHLIPDYETSALLNGTRQLPPAYQVEAPFGHQSTRGLPPAYSTHTLTRAEINARIRSDWFTHT